MSFFPARAFNPPRRTRYALPGRVRRGSRRPNLRTPSQFIQAFAPLPTGHFRPGSCGLGTCIESPVSCSRKVAEAPYSAPARNRRSDPLETLLPTGAGGGPVDCEECWAEPLAAPSCAAQREAITAGGMLWVLLRTLRNRLPA